MLSGRRYSVLLTDAGVQIIDNHHDDIEIVPVSGIRVIGELTDQNGPYREDWHLCLGDESDWTEIPVSAEGFESFFEQLGKELDFHESALAPSTRREASLPILPQRPGVLDWTRILAGGLDVPHEFC